MNVRKINDYIESSESVSLSHDLPQRRLTPIILSDSKGNYLKREVRNQIEKGIIWKNRKGQTAYEVIDWVITQIDNFRANYGSFELFVFLGTCDFCTKDRDNIIHLLPKSAGIPDRIIRKFCDLLRIARLNEFPVTFLEIPAFCIQEWNRRHGHESPEVFADDDKQLHSMIHLVNLRIRQLNRANSKITPNFNAALLKTRKNNSKKKSYRLTFSLYSDGIHSDKELSRYWLRKIAEVIRKQCY